MENRTDQELIGIVIGGDTTAFDTLFNRYREQVLQSLMQRTGSEPVAQDLLQETFVKVFLNIMRYDNNYAFGQWVHAIARNTFIDYTRKHRDNLLSSDEMGGKIRTVEALSNLPTPEEEMISAQSSVMLDKFMGRLPEHYNRMIVLRFYREYSYEEIAAELSLPLGTVKTRIRRAREALYQLIVNDKENIF